MTPHRHRDLIIAWANGATIEWFDGRSWSECTDAPRWVRGTDYRIKPEPKPDVVRFCHAKSPGLSGTSGVPLRDDNLRLTFDGETGKLKSAEVMP